MNPKVSILVPVYGVEKFIERCVISLLEQSFDDIEYVFVNDCTPDKSIEIIIKTLERYPNRIKQSKIINHDNNKGLAGARNTAVENSTGDFILHVDSDDYLELNAIELLYKKAYKYDAEVVMCDYYLEWTSKVKIIKQVFDLDVKTLICKMLSSQAGSSVWNKLILRDLYLKNNVRTVEGINYGEDFLVIPQIVYHATKVAKVDEPLYHYMQENENSYTQFFSEKNIENLKVVFFKLEQFFKGKEYTEEYLHSIKLGKARKKIEIINFAKLSTLKMYDISFFDTDSDVDISLNRYQRILLYFYSNKSFRKIEIMRKGFDLLKKVVKI